MSSEAYLPPKLSEQQSDPTPDPTSTPAPSGPPVWRNNRMLVGAYWESKSRKNRRLAWLQLELRKIRNTGWNNGVQQRVKLYKTAEPWGQSIKGGLMGIKSWEPPLEPPGPVKWEDMSTKQKQKWISVVKKTYMHELIVHSQSGQQGDDGQTCNMDAALDRWADHADWVDEDEDLEDGELVDEEPQIESGSVIEDGDEHVSVAVPRANRDIAEQGPSSSSTPGPQGIFILKAAGNPRSGPGKHPANTRIVKSEKPKGTRFLVGNTIRKPPKSKMKKTLKPSDPEWETLTIQLKRQYKAKLRMKAKKEYFDARFALAKYEEEKKKET